MQQNIQQNQQDNSQMNQGQDLPIGPEERAQLQSKLDQLNNVKSQFNASEFVNKNQIDQQRGDALKEVFDIMKQYGVDPGDVQQVTDFINQLAQEDPELYQVFITAFETLLGGSGIGESGTPGSIPSGNPSIMGLPSSTIDQSSIPSAMPSSDMSSMMSVPSPLPGQGIKSKFPNLAG